MITALSINPEYEKLFQILFYSRNAAFHKAGIHSKPSISITYKEKTFDFVEGDGIQLFDEDIEFLLLETMDFFKSVCETKELTAIPFIKDAFIEVYQKANL